MRRREHARRSASTERTLGIEIETEADDGIVRGRSPVSDRILQPYGLVHGGAMLTLAETLASHGTAVGVKDEGNLAMGQEISASLMRPISSGHVNGLATAAGAAAPPGCGRSRSPTTTAACAPSSAPRSRSAPAQRTLERPVICA